MADLFVSYSRRDKEFVRKLVDALLAQGRDVWIDWDDIPPSADWWKEIEQGIQSADSFVYIISPDSVRSTVVRQEIETAVVNNKRLIPIMWVEVKEQADLDQMHPNISAHNWIFFNQGPFEDAFKLLTDTLDTDLEYVKQHTRILVRAREWDRNGRDVDYVLRGDDLDSAQNWLVKGESLQPEPLPLQTQYIVASQRANAARQRVVRSGISLGFAISVILTLIAALSFREASIQRDQAERDRDRAVEAENAERLRANEVLALSLADDAEDAVNSRDLETAIALALEANLISPLPEVQQALALASYHPGVRTELLGPSGEVNTVAAALEGDTAISGDANGDIVIWDIASASPRFQIEGTAGHNEAEVLAVAMNISGTWAVSADENGLVIAWDVATGQELYRWEAHPAGEGFDGGVNDIAISAVDGSVFTVGNDGLLRQWSREGSWIREFPPVHSGPILSLAVTSDGSHALTGDATGQLVLWNVENGTNVATLENAHTLPINAIDVRLDGSLVVTAAGVTDADVTIEDATASLWSLEGDSLTFEKSLTITNANQLSMYAAAFSPDGLTVLTGAVDNSVYVWDVRSGRSIYELIIHTARVSDLAVFGNSLRAISASSGSSTDRSLLLIDIENGALGDRMAAEFVVEDGRLTELIGHTARVNSVAYSPDNRWAVSGGADGKVLLWNMEAGRLERQLDSGQHTDDVTAVDFSPSGRFAASGSEDDTAIIWDVGSATVLHTFTHDSDVKTLAFSPDGSILATGTRGGDIVFWDAALGTQIRVLEGHTRDVLDLAFTRSGDRLVSGSRDFTIRIWNVATGAEVQELEADSGSIFSVAFSPDGNTVLGGALRTVTQWDVQTGDILRTFSGHRSTINSVAFLPDGKNAISASADQTLILWNVDTADEVFRFEGHRQSVTDLDVSADGTRFISSSSDETIILWRNDTLNSLVEWTCQNRTIGQLDEDDLAAFRIDTPRFSCDTVNETAAAGG